MKDLATLKGLIARANDFSEPFNYFFDLMEQQPLDQIKGHRLIRKPEDDAIVLAMLEVVKNTAHQILGKKIEIGNPLIFYEIPAAKFYHGLCATTDHDLEFTMLYFSDIQLGMLTFFAQGETKMARFSLSRVEDLAYMH